MTNITESDSFDSGVYQIQTTDAAIGGPGGIANMPGQNLANRTRWLYNRLLALLNGSARYATTTTSTNAYAVNYTPAVSALVDGQEFSFYASNSNATNTGASTFTPCDGTVSGTTAISPLPILGLDGNALTGGEIVGQCKVRYSSGANNGVGAFYLVSNILGFQRAVTPPTNDNSTKTATTNWVVSNFAKLAGIATQTFSVAAATENSHAVNLGQLSSLIQNAMANVAQAAGFSYSWTGNGYVKLPSWLGGLIFQWGSASTTTSSPTTIYFPLSFPVGAFGVFATNLLGGGASIGWPGVGSASQTQFTMQTSSASGTAISANNNWFAIGR